MPISRYPRITAPDVVGPVIGWRCWRVADSVDGLALLSACRPVRWTPKRPLAASCDETHCPPSLRCTCGIYAAREPALPHAYLPPHVKAADRIRTQAVLGYDVVMAVGLVALWGEVIECDWGWRAQHAYPAELWVPRGVRHFRRVHRTAEIIDSTLLSEALADLYRIPVAVAESLHPDALIALRAA